MKKIKIILLFFLLAFNLSLLFHRGIISARPTALADKPFDILGAVFRLIRNDYIEEKNPRETMEGALRGMVNSLDPFSGYLNKETTSLYLDLQKQRVIYDVGLLLLKRYGFFPVVVGLMPDSPAEQEKIKIGDYITEIDGKSTASMSLLEVRLLLRSKQKNSVSLKVLREEQTYLVSLERIKWPNHLFAFRAQPGTRGWLQVYSLTPPLVDEIKQKVIPQLPEGNGSLIIDLRFCQEGILEEALKFINLFLTAEKIAFFQGRAQGQEEFGCPQKALLPEAKLVVWVSPATQNFSELVAAALQSNKKACVVGQETPGLLAKREFFLLRDGSSFFITTAKGSLSPNKPLWGRGVEPDIKLAPDEYDSSVYLQKTIGSQKSS